MGTSTSPRAPSSVRITAARSDASPTSRRSHWEAGRGTDVHHHLFGWHSPGFSSVGASEVRLDSSLVWSRVDSPRSPSTAVYSQRSGAWLSGDVHGRNVATERNRIYYSRVERGHRPQTPEFIRMQRIRHLVEKQQQGRALFQ